MHVMRSINDDIHTYSLIITSWKMRFTLKPSLNPVAWVPLKLSIAQIFPSVINSLIVVRQLICEIGLANVTVRDITYHTITLIHLLPMITQSLSNMFLVCLSERVEQNRRAQEGFLADKANKLFRAFTRRSLKYAQYIFHVCFTVNISHTLNFKIHMYIHLISRM